LASPRARVRTTLLALSVASAALLGVVPAQLSQAEPRPTIDQVQGRIDALNAQIASVNEDYNGSQMDLAAAKRRAGVAQGRVRVAEAQLKSVQKSIQAVAAAAYRSGGADRFVQLVSTSTPQTFLDRASSLDRIAAAQSAQMAAAATARHRFVAAQADADQERAAQQAIATKMERQKNQIEGALAEQQRLLGSLRADERRRLAAQQAARQQAAARASRSRVETYNGPASGRAAIAVQEAYRQLGKPYKWAAAGPDRFDCSGLTMWVWGKAGVSLPHQSRAQYAGGRKVAKSDLQPGDLTFYGSPIHHVGIYIGGGRMISAPQTGDVVKISNALRSDYVGAVRP
jgi:cell wall-associated NlpC family hydrolase